MIAIFFYFWFQERIIGLSKAHLLQKEQANDSETDIEDSSIKRNDSYPTLKQSEQSPVIKKKESKCSAEKEWQISIDILTPLQKHFLKTLILSCTSEDMIEDGKKSGKDEYIHEMKHLFQVLLCMRLESHWNYKLYLWRWFRNLHSSCQNIHEGQKRERVS